MWCADCRRQPGHRVPSAGAAVRQGPCRQGCRPQGGDGGGHRGLQEVPGRSVHVRPVAAAYRCDAAHARILCAWRLPCWTLALLSSLDALFSVFHGSGASTMADGTCAAGVGFKRIPKFGILLAISFLPGQDGEVGMVAATGASILSAPFINPIRYVRRSRQAAPFVYKM